MLRQDPLSWRRVFSKPIKRAVCFRFQQWKHLVSLNKVAILIILFIQFYVSVRDVDNFDFRLDIIPGENSFISLAKKFERACRNHKIWYEDI